MKENFKKLIKNKTPERYYQIKEFEGADYMISLSGDGMREKYYSGDKLAIQLLKDIDEIVLGHDYVIGLKDSVNTILTRQILRGDTDDTLTLHAYNPIREDMIIKKEKIDFVGKIIGLIRTNL